MLAAYLKMEGHEYLKQTLRSIVTNICNDDRTLEVNAASISEEESDAASIAKENMEVVLMYAQRVFDAIVASLDAFPG